MLKSVWEKKVDRIFHNQYVGNGFCAVCGEAVNPPKDLIYMLGKCPKDGEYSHSREEWLEIYEDEKFVDYMLGNRLTATRSGERRMYE